MAKSEYAHTVDAIQEKLRPLLRERGFRVRGRTFNRLTDDGLTQVVNLQMGPSDPPGTTYVPGLRENLHGLFTINLGVYVPEVARQLDGDQIPSWIQEHHCCVRGRLGEASGHQQDIWWHARPEDAVVQDVQRHLEVGGLPFLERFSTRDKIVAEWSGRSENVGASRPPRIVLAIILVERRQGEPARALLASQALETRNTGHAEYVQRLAHALGLGNLD